MAYTKRFDPPLAPLAEGPDEPGAGDRRDGRVYVYTDDIILAVNVALATGRPLLLKGPSGSGKSTLARHAARVLGWRYYEHVVTSRTQARDLLWRFDTLRRLNDAQLGTAAELKPLAAYVEPGVLWWAIEPPGARWRGEPPGAAGEPSLDDPTLESPDPDKPESDRAVLLIDEIDKADPDVPNSLLVPLGSLTFTVEDTGRSVPTPPTEGAPPAPKAPLVFITTNGERELPTAFLRRCIILELAPPDEDRLVAIAERHFGDGDAAFYRNVAKALFELKPATPGSPTPSTAEYLDAIRACRVLEVRLGSDAWKAVRALTLQKA